ncbi:MAG: LysR family transcriptional regulator [Alphaproteobacteria bacterium]|nr:LysR family transcriptional regulator [Alphaproteobacteria bacterium]
MRDTYLPTISELQAFLSCSQLGATTRAAKALNLTQSAISRSIHSLEERLGVQLFHRVRQRLILSDAGRVLQRDAANLLANLDQAAMTVMAFGGHSELLRLASLPTFASVWFIPKLQNFQQIMPNMTFDISAKLTDVDFENEAFDAAIQRGKHPSTAVESLELIDEYLIIVAKPEFLPNGKMLEDADLAKLPLLQQATRPTLWLDWFEHAGLDTRTILRGARFEHFDMVINAAIAGLGIGLVPEILVQDALKTGQLIVASQRRLLTDEPYCLVYPQRSAEIDGFENFKQWLLAETKSSQVT